MEKRTYAVSGMKCEHCKAKVENALKGLDGVRSVEASLQDVNVTVEYDECVIGPEQIKEAVENSGRYELQI